MLHNGLQSCESGFLADRCRDLKQHTLIEPVVFRWRTGGVHLLNWRERKSLVQLFFGRWRRSLDDFGQVHKLRNEFTSQNVR